MQSTCLESHLSAPDVRCTGPWANFIKSSSDSSFSRVVGSEAQIVVDPFSAADDSEVRPSIHDQLEEELYELIGSCVVDDIEEDNDDDDDEDGTLFDIRSPEFANWKRAISQDNYLHNLSNRHISEQGPQLVAYERARQNLIMGLINTRESLHQF
jgi:hypothetical protein